MIKIIYPFMLSSKRVNIRIKEETHTLAKLISTVKRMTLNEYFEMCIDSAVERDKDVIRKLTEKKNMGAGK